MLLRDSSRPDEVKEKQATLCLENYWESQTVTKQAKKNNPSAHTTIDISYIHTTIHAYTYCHTYTPPYIHTTYIHTTYIHTVTHTHHLHTHYRTYTLSHTHSHTYTPPYIHTTVHTHYDTHRPPYTQTTLHNSHK